MVTTQLGGSETAQPFTLFMGMDSTLDKAVGAEKREVVSSDYFCLFLSLLLFCVYVWYVHVHACVGQKSNLGCCSSFITGFLTGLKLTC